MKTKVYGRHKEILEFTMDYVDTRMTEERPTHECVDEWIALEIKDIVSDIQYLADRIEQGLIGKQTKNT